MTDRIMASTSQASPTGGREDRPLDVLCEDGERLYRSMWREMGEGGRREVLVAQPCAAHPTPGTVSRLAHECGLVGRWRSGAPLTLAPDVDNPRRRRGPKRNNDFDYSHDARGRQAPLGCHIRRMNPRDSKLTRLTDVNVHRLIRRGTTYGPPYDPNALSEEDDEVPRGAYFLFISAKAMATIEFLQQEWINDGNFIGVGGERDPIIGLQNDEATFTIPKKPVRRRVHGLETFNVLRGGEYLFMPSVSALRWLGELG